MAEGKAVAVFSGPAEYSLGWASKGMPWTTKPLSLQVGSNSVRKASIWIATQLDAVNCHQEQRGSA